MLDALQPLHDAPELLAHNTQVPASVAPTVVEYVPAAQLSQTALPLVVLYFPTTHAVHGPPFGPEKPTLQVQAASSEPARGELEAVGHATQVAAAEAPVVAKYVPAKQLAHAALPVAVLYLPATQAVHGPDPSGPEKPMLHLQSVTVELALGEVELPGHSTQVVATVAPVVVKYVPALQSVHTALPVASLYLPAMQTVHGPDPSGPEKPTLHVQSATDELPLGELELPGHATQVAAAEAPIVVKYVPAEQSVQTALPVAVLYLPAMQVVHGPDPSGPVKPTLHVQAATVELEIGEVRFTGHTWHPVDPTTLLYVPTAHGAQMVLLGPVKPASHKHVVSALPPLPEFAGQLVHACEPVVLLYVAEAQAPQEPPSGPE
jgi:hypothetical protein